MVNLCVEKSLVVATTLTLEAPQSMCSDLRRQKMGHAKASRVSAVPGGPRMELGFLIQARAWSMLGSVMEEET